MKLIFQKIDFSKSPGGNIYEWQEAETLFEVKNDAYYVIAITASAKNGKQNQSSDDDDLCIAIDGFDFGKYERHTDKISWKGFGTGSSWNGASLQGESKTNYYFIELKSGIHKIQFFADNNPTLEKIEVSQLKENEPFILTNQKLNSPIKTNKKGIPMFGFIFLGTKPKNFNITARGESGKQKGSSDGDDIKIMKNGKIIPNIKAPTSATYKNFYFAGDQLQGNSDTLILKTNDFLDFENTIELWIDENPILEKLEIQIFNVEKWWQSLDYKTSKNAIVLALEGIADYGRKKNKIYSAEFLENSLKKTPKNYEFKDDDSIVLAIKKDYGYLKIINLIKDNINENILDGEIYFGDTPDTSINFESSDLSTSLHGIKKVEFKAIKVKEQEYDVQLILFDKYDFDRISYTEVFQEIIANSDESIENNEVFNFLMDSFKKNLITIANNLANAGEDLDVVKNFEVKIIINEVINFSKDE